MFLRFYAKFSVNFLRQITDNKIHKFQGLPKFKKEVDRNKKKMKFYNFSGLRRNIKKQCGLGLSLVKEKVMKNKKKIKT